MTITRKGLSGVIADLQHPEIVQFGRCRSVDGNFNFVQKRNDSHSFLNDSENLFALEGGLDDSPQNQVGAFRFDGQVSTVKTRASCQGRFRTFFAFSLSIEMGITV